MFNYKNIINMKKITLTQKMIAGLLFLSSAMSYAQYCDPADNFDYVGEGLVEEITNVTFAGTSFSNTDNSVILVDMTSTTVNVSPGASYTFSVQGNAYGANYVNQYALFIDWDGDFDLFSAEDEGYYIGEIMGSTGQDNLFATNTIVVPETVPTGTVTRARIVKAYVDPGFGIMGNPCVVAMYSAEEGGYYTYGQALDFTVNVVTASVDNHLAGSFSVYPNPTNDVLNIANTIGAELISVSVTDLNGRTVKQFNSSVEQINISDLNAGVYFVNINSTEGSLTKKIVKK